MSEPTIEELTERAKQAEAAAGRLRLRLSDEPLWKTRAKEAEALLKQVQELRDSLDNARAGDNGSRRYSVNRREVIAALDEILSTPGLRAVMDGDV